MNQYASSLIESSPWAVALPVPTPVPLRRRYGSAWIVSGIVHGLLFMLGLWGGTQILEEPRPPIRLVFVEPPPPPPAPVNAPVATTNTPTVERPPTVEKKPQPQIQPKPKVPEHRKIVKAKRIQEPPKQLPPEPITPPQPEAVAEPTPATEAAPLESVNVASTTNPDNKGVIGGVTGGNPVKVH